MNAAAPVVENQTDLATCVKLPLIGKVAFICSHQPPLQFCDHLLFITFRDCLIYVFVILRVFLHTKWVRIQEVSLGF